MAENQKNLCAMIPAELHSRVRAAQEQAGLTLGAYMTRLLTDYYERGAEKMEKGIRTMAFQMPQEMFDRLKKLLEQECVLGRIQRALDEAEREGAADHGANLE